MRKTKRAIAGFIAVLMVMGMVVSGSSLYAFADEENGQSVETQEYVSDGNDAESNLDNEANEESVDSSSYNEPSEESSSDADEDVPEEKSGEVSDSDAVSSEAQGEEVPVDTSVMPETSFGSANSSSLLSAQADEEGHPTQPGEVTVSKTAKAVEGMVNTWDITLRVEAMDSTATSDIVLVIDRSLSMEGTRIAKAKDAAKKFIEELLPSTQTRIAVVSFAGNVTVDQSLTNDAQSLKTTVDKIKLSRGTFTQAGIKQAEALLANSTADMKNIVLLSDGEPTYSYDFSFNSNYFSQVGEARPERYESNTSIPQSAFNDRRAGDGSGITSLYPIRQFYYYYNHGNSTIAEAGFAKDAGYTVWTVALEAGSTGESVLSQVASPGKAYTATTSDLEKIFENIAGAIGAAVKNATVIDPMATGFTIPTGSATSWSASQGEVAYDDLIKRLSWTIGDLTKPISQGSNIKYAELTYRIELTDDILYATPQADGTYKTNGTTVLSYTDSDGGSATKQFAVPSVKPLLLVLEKKLIGYDGEEIESDDREYTINVSNGKSGDDAYNKDYVLKAGEKKILTNLRYEEEYTIKETATTDTDIPLSAYITTISGVDQDGKFIVKQGDSDKTFLVTNTEPSVDVSGEKTWDDKNDQDGIRPESIVVSLYAGEGESKELLGVKEVTEDDDWAWTFSDLPKYLNGEEIVYTIVEDEVEGYTATYDGYNITNTHVPETTSVNITKVWNDNGDALEIRPESVKVNLLANGDKTGYSINLDERGQWTDTFTGLDKYDAGEPINYTVEEEEVSGYESSIEGDQGNGYVITNTVKEVPPTPTPTPDPTPEPTPTVTPTTTPTVAPTATPTPQPTAVKAEKTGDNSNMLLWVGLLLIGGTAIAGIIYVKAGRKRAGK